MYRFGSALSSLEKSLVSHSATSSSAAPTSSWIPKAIHIVVLVHGWLGNDSELGYLQQALQQAAANTNEEEIPSSAFVVHSVTCNVQRTSDGIAAGGRRVADEVRELVKTVSEEYSSLYQQEDNSLNPSKQKEETILRTNPSISLSLVGHSLGGLYSRYALGDLRDLFHSSSASASSSETTKVHPAIFCTTASPHLGVGAGHTYRSLLPTFLEGIVGTIMQQTGKDLFRIDERVVMDDMATNATFLAPLAMFPKRIAYANAFHTDFQVPTSTAAFLSPESTSLHYYYYDSSFAFNDSLTTTIQKESLPPHFVVETKKNTTLLHELLQEQSTSSSSTSTRLPTKILSERLDALGWTKVFVDVRDYIPSYLPASDSFAMSNIADTDATMNTSKPSSPMPLTSSDLWNHFVAEITDDEQRKKQKVSFLNQLKELIVVPIGHTVIVANSKNKFYEWINRGGQPVMDRLANTLVQEILSAETSMIGTTTHETGTCSTDNMTTTP